MENIVENNRLIAEFMGDCIIAGVQEDAMSARYSNTFNSFKKCQDFCDGVNARIDVNKEPIQRTYFPVHKNGIMKYHSSWDWLMPVVEKIEALKYPLEIKDTACFIYDKVSDIVIAGGRIDGTKIQAIWLAVIQFINQYNKQPNQ